MKKRKSDELKIEMPTKRDPSPQPMPEDSDVESTEVIRQNIYKSNSPRTLAAFSCSPRSSR